MVNNKNLSNARFVPDTLIQRSMYTLLLNGVSLMFATGLEIHHSV